MTEPIPAATLILMRDRPGSAPEIAMMRRHAGLAFAADAWVFPGGRIEEGDRRIGEGRPDLDPEDAAARVAAIRETIEEIGLAIGLSPAPSPAMVADLRAGLAGGASFAALIAAAGLAFDLDALTPFARWAPPRYAGRRFDTRFYIARATDDVALGVDGFEGVELCWATADALTARCEAGTARMLFPTRATLARLAPLADHAAAAQAARAIPVRLIETIAEPIDARVRLSIPAGHGYPPFTITVDPPTRS